MRNCDSLGKWCLTWPWLASHATVDGSIVPRLSWGSRGAGMSGANDARLPSLIIEPTHLPTAPSTCTWTSTRTPSWYHTSSYAALAAGIIVAVSRSSVHCRMGELVATKMLVCLTRRRAGDRSGRPRLPRPHTALEGSRQCLLCLCGSHGCRECGSPPHLGDVTGQGSARSPKHHQKRPSM